MKALKAVFEHSELGFPTSKNYSEGKMIIQSVFDRVGKQSRHGVGQEN